MPKTLSPQAEIPQNSSNFKRGSVHIYYLLCLMALLFVAMKAGAQDTNQRWEVFLLRDIDAAGTDRLIFVETLTGEETSVEVFGERYTLVGRAVMFYNAANRRVMMASPDGTTRPHPFIQPGERTRRVDWLVSGDGSQLAWTLTEGDPTALTTVTTVANLDGTNPHPVLRDGPRNGIRVLPLAFSGDNTLLYMDYQPDGIGDFTPFRQYAGVFALDLKDSTVTYLPQEPGCFCGAGVGSGLFLRLSLTSDLSGYDLNIYNLATRAKFTVPALRLNNYTQAGDITVSPDGTRAVYALAQINDFGTADQTTEIVLMLVNLQDMTQTTLTQPLNAFIHPVVWSDDNSALLFTDPKQDGTWKVSLSEGRLVKVADAAYLGRL